MSVAVIETKRGPEASMRRVIAAVWEWGWGLQVKEKAWMKKVAVAVPEMAEATRKYW